MGKHIVSALRTVLCVLLTFLAAGTAAFALTADELAPQADFIVPSLEDEIFIGLTASRDIGDTAHVFFENDSNFESNTVRVSVMKYNDIEDAGNRIFLIVEDDCTDEIKSLALNALTEMTGERDTIVFLGGVYPASDVSQLNDLRDAVMNSGAEEYDDYHAAVLHNMVLEFDKDSYTRQYALVLTGGEPDFASLPKTGELLPLYFITPTESIAGITQKIDAEDGVTGSCYPATTAGVNSLFRRLDGMSFLRLERDKFDSDFFWDMQLSISLDGWEPITVVIEEPAAPVQIPATPEPAAEPEESGANINMYLIAGAICVVLIGAGVAIGIGLSRPKKDKDEGLIVVGASEGARAESPAVSSAAARKKKNAGYRSRRVTVASNPRKAVRAEAGDSAGSASRPVMLRYSMSADQVPARERFVTIRAGETVTVGRSSECGVSVTDKKLSREHFSITNIDGDLMVNDLGSTNGTVYNGSKLMGPALLHPNDTIYAGLTKFKILSID